MNQGTLIRTLVLLSAVWVLNGFNLNILQAQIQDVPFARDNFSREQRDRLREAIKDIKSGDDYFEIGRRATYLQALEFYLRANDFNPNNAELNYKIGKCYLYSLQKANAIYFLEKAYKIKPGISADIKYLLGQAYHFNQEIDKAVLFYTAYLATLPPNDPNNRIKDVSRRLEECDVAKRMMANPVRVLIENVGGAINTNFPEYAPVITADESKMLFTSSRDNTVGGGIDPVDLFYYEDIYISPRKTSEEWLTALHPDKPLNTEYHDATVGLSPDGQKLLMYRGDNGGDLYESRLNGDEYGEPVRFPKPINTRYHEPSACYSPDQNTLYFVSDRPGGFGGHDIYSSRLGKDGRWGDPVNLGPSINTEYDEIGVFMHPDGKTLYFASKGHATMGGYDIFRAVFENGKWSAPENLGYPINTTDDDVFLVLSADGRHGYYASYRSTDSFGEKDIYRLTFLGPEKPLVENNEDNLLASIIEPFRQTVSAPTVEIKTSQLTLLKGTVYDAVTLEPLGAAIDITDNSKNELVSSFESNNKTGKYLVALPSGINYGIAVRAEGYLFHSENFDIPVAQGYQEIVKDIYLNKIEIGKKIILRNIFYDFDKYT
ncbi:MAG: hypothetical protein NTU44_00855, partial [Bacteroidetes bacterium]|nr:hypothetical protein [Bacteroidota bacterium]